MSPGRPPARRPGPARPWMGWKAAFFGLTIIAIVAAVAWALLGSRFLIVRSVRVTGTGPTVSRAQVIAAARIPSGLPLIRVSTSAVAHRVGAIRQVQSAQVSRDWPSTIVIAVRLRTPVFAVAGPGGYALVDAFGVDLRNSARRPLGFPLLLVGSAAGMPPSDVAPAGASGTGHAHKPHAASRSGKDRKSGKTRKPGPASGSASPAPSGASTPASPKPSTPAATGQAAETPLRGNPAVRAAATVLRELPPVIAHRVRAVLAPTASDVWLRLSGGVVIVWGDTSRPAEKAKELSLLMHTHARSYDVSAPGTAVTQG